MHKISFNDLILIDLAAVTRRQPSHWSIIYSIVQYIKCSPLLRPTPLDTKSHCSPTSPSPPPRFPLASSSTSRNLPSMWDWTSSHFLFSGPLDLSFWIRLLWSPIFAWRHHWIITMVQVFDLHPLGEFQVCGFWSGSGRELSLQDLLVPLADHVWVFFVFVLESGH